MTEKEKESGAVTLNFTEIVDYTSNSDIWRIPCPYNWMYFPCSVLPCKLGCDMERLGWQLLYNFIS